MSNHVGRIRAGLEGVVGSPSPKLLVAMREEHCNRPDSDQEFVTDNYGVRTTSKTEFLFVYDPNGEAPIGIEWPRESTEMLPDPSRARRRWPMSELEHVRQRYNEQLEEVKQPGLLPEEIVAANLYTGPVRSAPSNAPPRRLLTLPARRSSM